MKRMMVAIGMAMVAISALAGVRVEQDDKGGKAYRDGELKAFAEWKAPSEDIAFKAYAKGDFVYFEVSPAIGTADREVMKIVLPEIEFEGVERDKFVLLGSGGLTNIEKSVSSFAFAALANPKTRKGYVAAWLTDEWASGVVKVDGDEITAFGEYGKMLVKAGSRPKTDIFVFGAFDDCRKGLEAYGDAIAEHYSIKLPKQESGFCSWYCDNGGYRPNTRVRGAMSAALSTEFLNDVVAKNLRAYGFDYYQIDDDWQAGSNEGVGPRKGFWKIWTAGPYPKGVKPLADECKALGIRPGIWCMPLSGDPLDKMWDSKSNLYVKAAIDAKEKKGRWKLEKGKPYTTWFGAGALDGTNPEARKYMRDLMELITKKWNFSLIKFDGMYSGFAGELGRGNWYDAGADTEFGVQKFKDPEASHMRAYRQAIAAMREGSSKDTQFLACNVAQNARGMAASYGIVEMLRIGGDNGPIDSFPERYMAGPLRGSPRYFFNGRVWYNDPDPVYVRDAVPAGRARLMASWTSLGALLYNFSDWLGWLSEERVEILKRTLAPHNRPKQVRPIDTFEREIPNVWKLTDGERAVFGLYNWATNQGALKIDYPMAYCDLDPEKTYVGFDFWNNKFVPAFKGRFAFKVPADDCRVISVMPVKDHPFVISTSRHVASPIFDVVEEKWDAATKTLSGVSEVVPGEKYEIRVFDGSELRRFTFEPTEKRFAWKILLAEEQAGIFDDGGFFVGCNYWCRNAGMYMWSQWDPVTLEKEMRELAKNGVTVMRVFPLWPDFQPLTGDCYCGGGYRSFRFRDNRDLPNWAGVDDVMVNRFRHMCDLAEKNGIRLIVGIVTGWMSGRQFVPSVFEERNVLSDPGAIMWQTRFVKYFVDKVKDKKAIVAWDYGNECNCMGAGNCGQAAFYNWMDHIGMAIRSVDSTRPVVSGMHGLSTKEDGAVNVRLNGEISDILCTHPYALYVPGCGKEAYNTMRVALHPTAESLLYQDLGGKKCFIEEVGNLGNGYVSEARSAAGIRQTLFSAWANDLKGLLWWCNSDQESLQFPPYSLTACERELGLLRNDYTPKPVMREMKAFTDFIGKLPFKRLPARKTDAVIVVPEKVAGWISGFGCYLLAREAGFDVSFAGAEKELPESDFYILASVNCDNGYSYPAQQRLFAKAKDGATVLIINTGNARYTDYRGMTGNEVDYGCRASITRTFALKDMPEAKMTAYDDFTMKFIARESEVLAAAEDGEPVMTSFKLGFGKVLVINSPIDSQAIARTDCFTGKRIMPYYQLFRKAASIANVRKVVEKGNCPWVCMTEHPRMDGSAIVVAINFEPREIACPVKINGKLGNVWRGKVESDSITLAPNEAAVFEVLGCLQRK